MRVFDFLFQGRHLMMIYCLYSSTVTCFAGNAASALLHSHQGDNLAFFKSSPGYTGTYKAYINPIAISKDRRFKYCALVSALGTDAGPRHKLIVISTASFVSVL
jgi:hypothetical protein